MEFHHRLSPQKRLLPLLQPAPRAERGARAELATVDYHNTLRAGRRARGPPGRGRALLSRRKKPRPGRGRLCHRGRAAGARHRHAHARTARRDRARTPHKTFRGLRAGRQPEDDGRLHHSGFEVERRLDGGVFYVTFPIDADAGARRETGPQRCAGRRQRFDESFLRAEIDCRGRGGPPPRRDWRGSLSQPGVGRVSRRRLPGE